MNRLLALILGLSVPILASPARGDEPSRFEFRDGDRVVLIGDTLIERDQKFGDLETLLTLRNPGKAITFRNLGWSGDTVLGEARAGFGTQPDGFRQLKEHVLALKPTVLLVGYGMSDSFAGEAAIPAFVRGLEGLLDVLAETHARVVLLSPIAHEDLGRPLPDPSSHNEDLKRYRDAIARVATARGHRFVDLFRISERRSTHPRTDNGIHLTAAGSWEVANAIAQALGQGGPSGPWRVEIFHESNNLLEVKNARVSGVKTTSSGLQFEATAAILPEPPPLSAREDGGNRGQVLEVSGLAPGTYRLSVDGQAIGSATTSEMKHAIWTFRGPDFAQVERLRGTINAKNLLYFHRWRPQNETYLFGFRKHEQGNNAREIPLFDPLVEKKEKEIAALRMPASHVYELARESESTK